MANETRNPGWRARDVILVVPVILIVGALVAARLYYTPYHIPSASMVPTLLQGEYVAAQNSVPSLHVGDVVFHTEISPMSGRPTTFVRRVLALPGQRIAFRNGVPIVDGVTAQQAETNEVGPEGERIVRETIGGRSYRVAYQAEGSTELRNMAERVVPVGRVFLVGDARDNAVDSRIHGPHPISSIKQLGGWIVFSPVSGRAGHRIE